MKKIGLTEMSVSVGFLGNNVPGGLARLPPHFGEARRSLIRKTIEERKPTKGRSTHSNRHNFNSVDFTHKLPK